MWHHLLATKVVTNNLVVGGNAIKRYFLYLKYMVPENLELEQDDKANAFQRTLSALTLDGQYPEEHRSIRVTTISWLVK